MRWPSRRPPILPRVADRDARCEAPDCGSRGDAIYDPGLKMTVCLACRKKLPRPAATPVDEPASPPSSPSDRHEL